MKKRSMQSGSVALSMALMLAGSPMYVKAASQVQSVTQQADEMTVGGVILVTTKHGKAGPARLNYSATFGWQTRTREADYCYSKEKYNGRINLDGNVGRKLEYNFGFVFRKEDLSAPNNPNRGNVEIFALASSISPMVPYKKENGDYGYTGDGNPIAWLDANTKF